MRTEARYVPVIYILGSFNLLYIEQRLFVGFFESKWPFQSWRTAHFCLSWKWDDQGIEYLPQRWFHKLPSLSKTRRLSSYPNGLQPSKNSHFAYGWCCEMLLHAGICHWISRSPWVNHWESEDEVEAIWADRGWLENRNSALRHPWSALLFCVLFNSWPSLIQQIFKDATLFFLHSTPNIATVIPAMDHLDEHLTNAALNPKYSMLIKATIAIEKKTLNWYYNKTDHSDVFCISMGIFSFIIWFVCLTNSISQCYILNTSADTLSKLGGRILGLRKLKNLYILSLNGCISTQLMIFWPNPPYYGGSMTLFTF